MGSSLLTAKQALWPHWAGASSARATSMPATPGMAASLLLSPPPLLPPGQTGGGRGTKDMRRRRSLSYWRRHCWRRCHASSVSIAGFKQAEMACSGTGISMGMPGAKAGETSSFRHHQHSAGRLGQAWGWALSSLGRGGARSFPSTPNHLTGGDMPVCAARARLSHADASPLPHSLPRHPRIWNASPLTRPLLARLAVGRTRPGP